MTPTPLGASKTIDRQIGKKSNIKHTIDDLFFDFFIRKELIRFM
jgi:hypothetical protein